MGVTLDGVESSFRSKGEREKEREGRREDRRGREREHRITSRIAISLYRSHVTSVSDLTLAISLILSHPVAARLIYIVTRELINLDWPIRIERRYQKLFPWYDWKNILRTGYVLISNRIMRSIGLQFHRRISWENSKGQCRINNIKHRKIQFVTVILHFLYNL